MSVDILDAHSHNRQHLVFYLDGINRIFAIAELHYLIFICANSHVITNHEIFKTLNQSSLNVSSGGCFDGSINQTNTTTHCMKEQLLGCQAVDVGILYKPTRARRVVILCKMRQRTLVEPIWNTLSIHVLLAQAGNHLGDVEVASLGPRIYHHNKSVVLVQALKTYLACLGRCLIQDIIDLRLKLFHIGLASIILKYT